MTVGAVMIFQCSALLSHTRESNPTHPVYETSALPRELEWQNQDWFALCVLSIVGC